ncbi:MAG: Gfo/Idh/MocA family oxidoreductase [Candidatus Latescibacteria bacterium]|jgi:predicted dehydrogenase|nr:Gfo/Idh/MocA family oxidoreductase [Candidatus Latescibacterota bacterium]
MKPVRWGIVGAAKIFIKAVILPMQKSELMELYAVASRNPEKAKQISRQYGIPRSFSSYEELLADKSIEAVYIPLPNNIHLEWIKKAADAGKHILCEKPLGLNGGEAQEALEYARKKGVLLMEAFMYRFHPQWIRAKELISTENIGSLRAVQTFFSYNNTDPKNIRNILETGGGAVLDIGCYAISTARYLFGREPKRVVSLINRSPAFKTDILSSGIMDFGDGHSTFTVGTQSYPYQKVDIIGSGGRIHIHIPFNTYTDVPAEITVTNSVGSRKLLLGPEDQYKLQFERFSEAVRSDGPAPTPPEDAVNNLNVMDAFFKSEKSGGWEEV